MFEQERPLIKERWTHRLSNMQKEIEVMQRCLKVSYCPNLGCRAGRVASVLNGFLEPSPKDTLLGDSSDGEREGHDEICKSL